MTHDKWVALSPEEQRIKVAELRGFKKDLKHPLGSEGNTPWIDPSKSYWVYDFWNLPDSLNDLNAMHEAENLLTLKGQRGRYLRGVYYTNLLKILERELRRTIGMWDELHATAAQRAEAFVLTMESE
jgi:hypothetical protein